MFIAVIILTDQIHLLFSAIDLILNNYKNIYPILGKSQYFSLLALVAEFISGLLIIGTFFDYFGVFLMSPIFRGVSSYSPLVACHKLLFNDL